MLVEATLKDKPVLSIVVPVYNEEDSVLALYTSVRNTCSWLTNSYELIFVDDGSQDRTSLLLKGLHQSDPNVKVICFRKNFGQTAAMAAGFQHARGDVIISMDGDLQNDPADIPRLLSKLEGFDVVCGWREKRQDKFWTRRLPSIIANWVIGRVTGVRIQDNGCSLKAYRSSVIKSVTLYGEMHRFIPAMATLAGARITEIAVSHHPRRFGKSKYGLGRIWRVALDIVTVKVITGFASRPALWFGLPSIAFFLLGFFAFLLVENTYSASDGEGWLAMSTVAFLFLLLGSHLLTMGVIAELSMKTGSYRPEKTVNLTILSS